mmetsp:Transcript_18659/g.31197  ORF Transcript_18659/g.31197 Transcript_18659/m.31197 type:complete len:284 (+) Transcript_18659:119-970(+)|eukprot:CAMPEP_0119338998 /NCGR_PEP_ID=MMETSP1333-20130426/97334_1 /TAXON_ID=418940 /ORGANISM="Scyphosphaera apsteinii, Strain RCC1455" /LENGTH=283 /DNA_ID=CAMNT_0007350433 /DNA_START=95 /DNA_END=946 /DNA_ORIENTATION=-
MTALPEVLLIAEAGDVSVGEHTPRYEPSWFFEEIAQEMIAQCLRPRVCAALDDEAKEWLYKRLVTQGHEANRRGYHFLAHSHFECAYCVRATPSELLSSINMRLRLGQCTLAKNLYERVLQMQLTDAQLEVAERKLQESQDAIARREVSATQGRMEDELEQLIADGSCSLPAAELPRLLQLMRAQGHFANQQGDFESAQMWFDCTFTASRRNADMLSAANMRAKLVPASPVAEALYKHLLTVDGVSEKERQMAETKLQQIAREKSIISREHNSMEYGSAFTDR